MLSGTNKFVVLEDAARNNLYNGEFVRLPVAYKQVCIKFRMMTTSQEVDALTKSSINGV